jgi:FkbH-like protein
VRQTLPEVAVPEIPEDPAGFVRCLARVGYFEAVHFTAEDLGRAEQYRANAARATSRETATDMHSYLAGLQMKAYWRPFAENGLARVVQLINKTNQFNLTTRRATDESVSALIADENALTLQIRLVDQFGDNGIIAIVIGQFDAGTRDIRIDTWLMSCRVLGRQVEEATLNLIAQEAKRLGAARLIGEYRPTAKNEMVRSHYEKLGFAPLATDEPASMCWILDLVRFVPKPTFIRSVATGADISADVAPQAGPVSA